MTPPLNAWAGVPQRRYTAGVLAHWQERLPLPTAGGGGWRRGGAARRGELRMRRDGDRGLAPAYLLRAGPRLGRASERPADSAGPEDERLRAEHALREAVCDDAAPHPAAA